MPHDIKADQAFQIDLHLRQIRRSINENFLTLAQLLKEVRDKRYWQTLEYDSFNAYIAQPDLSLQRSSVYDLIAIYEKYVEGYGVQPAGLSNMDWTKLAETLPYVNKRNHEEMIEKAGSLSRSDLREELRLLREPNVVPIMPEGLYHVIYADPLWEYVFPQSEVRDIPDRFPIMSFDEIKGIQVPANPDSVLLLWSTAPKLSEALEVMRAWGFEYTTNMVWDKVAVGMGYWFRGQHELLLVATKGKFSPPEQDARVSSVIRQKRGKHSQKPHYFRELISKAVAVSFEKPEKLEMFARSRPGFFPDIEYEGWDVFGNEVNNSIEI